MVKGVNEVINMCESDVVGLRSFHGAPAQDKASRIQLHQL